MDKTDNPGPTILGTHRVGPDVGIIRGAVQRLILLSHATRQGRFNEQHEQSCLSFFAHQVGGLLEQQIAVSIEITEGSLWYSENEIAGSDLMSEALVEGLYSEGLRGVFIDLAASEEELRNLAMLLTRNWVDKEAGGAQLEAMAWEQGFDNVHLDIAARRIVTEADDDLVTADELVERLLRQLGSAIFDGEHEVWQAGIASLLDDLRGLPSQLDADLDEKFAALRVSGAYQRFSHQIEVIHTGDDVGGDLIGRVAFEMIRGAASAEEVEGVVQSMVRHASWDVAEGRPEKAFERLRRIMLLTEVDLFPELQHRDVLCREIEALWNEEFLAAILKGWQRNPDARSWVGPLFSLGQIVVRVGVTELLELGCVMPERALSHALADALLVGLRHGDGDLRELLDTTEDRLLPVVILAFRRQLDRTMVERLLSKVSSKNSKVREAVLVALREQQSPRIKVVMRKALADEDRGVRLEALRYLAVYRDIEASALVLKRLYKAREDACDLDELSALARAYAIIARERNVADFRELIIRNVGARNPSHPGIVDAVLSGMSACGPPGRRALQQLGRDHPDLREKIRGLLGGTA